MNTCFSAIFIKYLKEEKLHDCDPQEKQNLNNWVNNNSYEQKEKR